MIKVTCGKGEEYLTEDEKEKVNQISQAYFDKISNHIKDIEEFEVHLKCHKKEGNTKRYVLGIRIVADGQDFDSEVEDYNLNDGIKKAIVKIQNEIEHKIHKSDQGRKPRKK